MSILDLIGNTPLLELTGLNTGLCQLFVKLENQNPSGSIKDRIALSMIDQAEKQGLLKPGYTIIEATAGNTGLGLALVASQRKYQLNLVVPDKMSREKISYIRAMGATITITRSDVAKGDPAYYQDLAARLAKEIPNSWYANQFSNPANPQAHYNSTGPEIWQQMRGKVDAVVVGVGSGGTLGGLSKYFEQVAPHLEMVLADPVGSILATYVETKKVLTECGSWLVEGIGEDFIPEIADFSRVKKAYSIADQESFLTCRELLSTNGILAGSSSGTLIAAALRYCQEQTTPKRVVTFICDGGARYLSKTFNDNWMIDQGFITKPEHGDLRDLLSRSFSDGTVVSITPNDRCASAYARMKTYEISQLPVLENSRVVGMLDESDLLIALRKDPQALQQPVKQFMSQNLQTFQYSDSIDSVVKLLKAGYTAIIMDQEKFYGIVTRMDVVDYLRRVEGA